MRASIVTHPLARRAQGRLLCHSAGQQFGDPKSSEAIAERRAAAWGSGASAGPSRMVPAAFTIFATQEPTRTARSCSNASGLSAVFPSTTTGIPRLDASSRTPAAIGQYGPRAFSNRANSGYGSAPKSATLSRAASRCKVNIHADWVRGQDDGDIIPVRELLHRLDEMIDDVPVLAAVACDSNDLAAGKAPQEPVELRRQRGFCLQAERPSRAHPPHRFRCDELRSGGRFPAEGLPLPPRWGAIETGDHANELAVPLLRPRIVKVASTQTCFDMAHGVFLMVRRQSPGHRAVRIDLHHHPIGLLGRQRSTDADQRPGGQLVERIA